jgi:DNA-binding response OmpR family regulator
MMAGGSKMKKKILIVEDEAKIARVILLELEYEGYDSKIATTGKQAIEMYQQDDWDVILLDIMLPQMNGIEVLRRIRSKDQMTPIILLTARDSVVDKITGLDQGANDYITKPFQIEELLARIRAVLRTTEMWNKQDEQTTDNQWQIADLQLNEKTREVSRAEQRIELTPREFDLLLYFIQHSKQVLTREQLITHVWGYDYYSDTNIVDVYIRYLRKKIDYPFQSPLIYTVRGVGYMLKESK